MSILKVSYTGLYYIFIIISTDILWLLINQMMHTSILVSVWGQINDVL